MPLRTLALAALFALAATAGCRARGGRDTPTDVPAPFAVRADASGLVFTYGDAEGFHSVERIADVPAAARANVRVEPLAGDRSLEAGRVWVVDLRAARPDGTYAVVARSRDAFERSTGPSPVPAPAPAAAAATGEVVLYGTSWCGACRTAREYFRSRGIAFQDRDIEREPGARDEMIRKATAQGISPRGVPVIDVHGQIVPGFDRGLIDRLLAGG